MREISPASQIGINIPEQHLIEDAWNNYHAWDLLSAHLSGERTTMLTRYRAPIPAFAERAAMIGFVKTDPDDDGAIRTTQPSLITPVGVTVPLGVAAVLAGEGRGGEAVSLDPGRSLRVAERIMPLVDGRIWLYWPTSQTSPRWIGLLRGAADDPESVGHMSIGSLIQLADQRRSLERSLETLRELGWIILQRRVQTVDEKFLADLADEAEYQRSSSPPGAGAQELSDEERIVLEAAGAVPIVIRETRAAQDFIARTEQRVRDDLKDRLVFVGYTHTAAMTDVHPTAVGARTPGVIVHAVVADMLLSRRSATFPSFTTQVLLTALLGLISTALALRFTGVLSGLLTVVVLSVYILFAGLWLFDYASILVPVVGPMTSGVGAWLVCTAFEAAMLQRERLRITRQFKARVSGQLVDFLIDNPEALSMSGDERDVTVLFCDLANFTAVSEQLGGPTTVALLNRYMTRLTELLIEHRGYVNKFLGDGLMAFWSAFAYDADQAAHACRAVVECHRALHELNVHPDFRNFPSLSMRAGITTGRVIVGDCGAPPHLNDYTVIGDAVNLASRLEAANKQFGTSILIDDATRKLIDHEDELCTRFLGRVAVMGQTRAVLLHELLPAPCDPADIELSEAAARAFMEGEIDESRTRWREYTERFGPRPFAELYLEAIAREGPAASGILILQSK